jgi:hypothetical protein
MTDELVAEIREGGTTVEEVDGYLEPHETVFLLGEAYRKDGYDDSAIYPDSLLLGELGRYRGRERVSDEMLEMPLIGSVQNAMLGAVRIPYKVVANSFNSVRYNMTRETPDLLQAGLGSNPVSPERMEEYIKREMDTASERLETDMPHMYGALTAGFVQPNLIGAGIIFSSVALAAQNEAIEEVFEEAGTEMEELYEEMIEELGDREIQPVRSGDDF